MGQHRFMATCRSATPQRVGFDGAHWLKYYPQRNPGLRPSTPTRQMLSRGHEFTMSQHEPCFWNWRMRKPIAQILKHRQFANLAPNSARLGQNFYRRMWRQGTCFTRPSRSSIVRGE